MTKHFAYDLGGGEYPAGPDYTVVDIIEEVNFRNYNPDAPNKYIQLDLRQERWSLDPVHHIFSCQMLRYLPCWNYLDDTNESTGVSIGHHTTKFDADLYSTFLMNIRNTLLPGGVAILRDFPILILFLRSVAMNLRFDTYIHDKIPPISTLLRISELDMECEALVLIKRMTNEI